MGGLPESARNVIWLVVVGVIAAGWIIWLFVAIGRDRRCRGCGKWFATKASKALEPRKFACQHCGQVWVEHFRLEVTGKREITTLWTRVANESYNLIFNPNKPSVDRIDRMA